jgi:hypothetical protein
MGAILALDISVRLLRKTPKFLTPNTFLYRKVNIAATTECACDLNHSWVRVLFFGFRLVVFFRDSNFHTFIFALQRSLFVAHRLLSLFLCMFVRIYIHMCIYVFIYIHARYIHILYTHTLYHSYSIPEEGSQGRAARDRRARKGQAEEDCLNRTTSSGQPEKDCTNKAARTGLRGQDYQNRTVRIDLTGQEC